MTSLKILLAALFFLAAGCLSYATAGPYVQVEPSSRSLTPVDLREVVRSNGSGTVVRSTSGACVRTRWIDNQDDCATEISMPRAVSRSVIARVDRTVYFEFDRAVLLPEMKQRLDTLASRLRADRNVRGAQIVGYADRIGNPSYNEKLSKKRAEAARRYLIARGVINTNIAETRWLGEDVPVTDCPDDLTRERLIECLQPDRRVEVEIDYIPTEAQASR